MLHDRSLPFARRLRRRRAANAAALALAALGTAHVRAQDRATLDPVVVTATREAQRSFDLPASVDTIGRAEIQQGQPMINLSESLVRVPGIVALNRWNYAQDLQLSSRGFGSRATFGVRGIRLYQDDIPQTMPDGQGQTGSFQLFSTDRIEVLRGPFSTLYGNASGGVIAVFTESGAESPDATFAAGGGSFGSWTAGAKFTGTSNGVGYVAAGTAFQTDGFREHSAAERNLGAAKVSFSVGPATSVTVLGTLQDQPESLDPLGLTRAQWQADPRQADPAALLFDTRKTVHQQQGGLRIDQAFGDDTKVRVTGYGGTRQVRQYLALTGIAPTSSGGVTDLDRDYGGASVKLFQRFSVAERPLTLVLGVDWDTQRERRQGYVNDFGNLGALRRNEIDTVTDNDYYAQVSWDFASDWSAIAGVRTSRVRFRSQDEYVTPTNPDDSGSRNYRDTTPVAGIVFHATDDLNLYANYGQGFETPTFAELAYRPVGSGLNFDLQPATSVSAEIGAKAIVASGHRLNAALFWIETDDEIVINSSTGGRTTFRNAGKTKRRGAEFVYDGAWGSGVTAHLACTWLRAWFATEFLSGSPPSLVPAGNRLPGVPATSVYGELAWVPPTLPWLTLAAEVQSVAKIYVNDRNSDAAPAYVVGNLRVGVERRIGDWTLRAFARLNNIADVNYVGSVIVGDTNGRYFEPSPGRNYYAGVSANVPF
jgi:iron complex outermembrane receptor protein